MSIEFVGPPRLRDRRLYRPWSPSVLCPPFLLRQRQHCCRALIWLPFVFSQMLQHQNLVRLKKIRPKLPLGHLLRLRSSRLPLVWPHSFCLLRSPICYVIYHCPFSSTSSCGERFRFLGSLGLGASCYWSAFQIVLAVSSSPNSLSKPPPPPPPPVTSFCPSPRIGSIILMNFSRIPTATVIASQRFQRTLAPSASAKVSFLVQYTTVTARICQSCPY